ncbi:MAG: GntR family transcriptional regulator [Anaerolineae bacterium]
MKSEISDFIENVVIMSVSNLPSFTRPNISDEVYAVLKERILSRQFAFGQRLNLSELEEQMGISRTPLKEALNRLALEGLVEIQPRRGTFVVDPTAREIAESFDVRRVLEVWAVELALKRVTESELEQMRDLVTTLRRLTDIEDWDGIYQEYCSLDHDLHRLIVEIAGNQRLKEVWEQVNVHVEMARTRYGKLERERELTQQGHERILRAFETRDLPALREAISHHIDQAKQSVLEDLKHLKA